jgi:hypothetical protein
VSLEFLLSGRIRGREGLLVSICALGPFGAGRCWIVRPLGWVYRLGAGDRDCVFYLVVLGIVISRLKSVQLQ